LIDKENGTQHSASEKNTVSPEASYIVGTSTYSEESFENDPYFRVSFSFLSNKKITDQSKLVDIDMSKLPGQYESFPEDCSLRWQKEEVLLIHLSFKSNGSNKECFLRLKKI
jgi:hypothetical protein